MKKWMSLMAFALLISFASSGQDFKKFKAGIGFGYALPSDGGGGIAFYIEPMYRIKDNIAIGLRWESAAVVPANVLSGSTTVTPSASVISSFSLNGQYYFNNNKFRPFVGAGVGSYTLAAVETSIGLSGSGSLSVSPSVSAIGFYPRIGFDYGHFNMILDYNIIPAQTVTSNITILGVPIVTTTERKATYIGIKIGFSFGGGTK